MALDIGTAIWHRVSRLSSIIVVIASICGSLSGQAVAAEAELAGVLADLRGALDSFDRPQEILPGLPDIESSMRKLTAVAARLDLFEQTFGLRRETVKGWAPIQAAAKAALSPTRTKEGDRYYAIDASDMNRAILQEIAGDPEGALASLGRIKPGGMCGNWIATVELAVNSRQSAILEREGRHREALAAHERAVECAQLALHSQNFPVLYVRHASLLEKNGRAPDAWVQYQRVVDLFPGTPGEAIARSRLAAEGRLVTPTASRVAGYLSSSDRREAILALAAHRFPESLDLLLPRLGSDQLDQDTVIEALARLGDPRAIQPLQARVEHGPPGWIPSLLPALHRLGDTSRILPGLQRLLDESWIGSGDRQRLQEMLIEVAPGGPTQNVAFRNPRSFANPWIAYLEKTGADSGPATSRRSK